MKISTLMLANHAEVRDGRLNVLSGFINILWRTEFPSPMKVYLVAVLEATGDELQNRKIDVPIEIRCEGNSSTEPLFTIAGKLEAELENSRGAFFPVVFDISNAELLEPGEYKISMMVNDAEEGTYTFFAEIPVV